MLKNITEVLVRQKMEHILESQDCCKCEQCKEDIMAYTLNHVPAHYVSTDEGSLFAKTRSLSAQFEVKIITELAKAIKVVSENPRH